MIRPGAALLALLVGCGEPSAEARKSGDGDSGAPRPEPPATPGAVRLVRAVSGPERYAFEPPEVHVRPGQAVRFVLAGPEPESVAFDTVGLPEAGRRFVQTHSLERGPLLTSPGQSYDVRLDGAPPGRYPFHSLTHAGAGMRGTVVVDGR